MDSSSRTRTTTSTPEGVEVDASTICLEEPRELEEDFSFRTIIIIIIKNVKIRVTLTITDELARCLQSVQNAAARLVTGTRRCDHSSPVLHLHWLPVRQRVVFKIATLVHRSLPDNASGYLADDCQLFADARVRQLHSADTRTLVVSWTVRPRRM